MSGHTQTPERKDGRLNMLRHFPTLLNRWRGSHAQMTELTTSHRTLRILLRREGHSGHLLIACIYPLTIHAPVEWTDADVTIGLHGAEDFVVIDTRAEVRVVTGSVEVVEHV
jgi:hypothetical protein